MFPIKPSDVHEMMMKLGIRYASFFVREDRILYEYIYISPNEYQFGKEGDILTNFIYNHEELDLRIKEHELVREYLDALDEVRSGPALQPGWRKMDSAEASLRNLVWTIEHTIQRKEK